MKYYPLAVLLFLIACDNATNGPISADEYWIVGKWKQTEAFISAGGPQYWVDVENGEEIEFFKNATFSSDRYNECHSGKFSIEGNKLLLEYPCLGFNPTSENEEGLITYEMELFPDSFILIPTSGPICIEGCSFRYQQEK